MTGNTYWRRVPPTTQCGACAQPVPSVRRSEVLDAMNRNGMEHDSVEFDCPQCGAAVGSTGSQCPQCGHVFTDEGFVTYRPPAPRAVRIIALVLLVVAFLVPLVLLLYSMLT